MFIAQKPYRVVFMGSPEFSVPCLRALYESPDFEVVAVYSMPDRPKGRGKALTPTAVKAFALEHDIPVRTPLSFKKSPEEVEILRSFKSGFLSSSSLWTYTSRICSVHSYHSSNKPSCFFAP